MAGEMVGDIGPRHFIALGRLTCHDNNFSCFGPYNKWHRIGHGTRRTPAAVPAHHDAIKLQTGSLNIGNDEHGPTRVEQRCLDDEPLKCRLVRLRLTDDGQIEPSHNVGENIVWALATGTSTMRDSA